VSALGAGVDATWAGLRAGSRAGLRRRDDLAPGLSAPFAEVSAALPEVPAGLARYACRANRLSSAAFAEIAAAVSAARERFGAARIGVVLGSSNGGLAETERALATRLASGAFPSGFDLVQLEFGGVAEFLARLAGAEGPAYTISTACTSGAKALVSARSLLALGVCDAVIAGGVDSLCALTAGGFAALQAVAKDGTNPMSANRAGITLGEGAALFLVTREPGGLQLLGAGESSDAHHMSAPDPEGRGAEACMRAALADARLAPESVAYLNLHGTGTPQNDASESAAVARVFPASLPCSSTKPLVGHALGASGALEAAFCWLVLARREGAKLRPPPHRWDGVRDPKLAPLALVESGAVLDAPAPAALVSNSFGFGGSNCSLAIGEARS
jgi:3-oxoacyl-[acyl-carrier-protein] synthase-1